MAHDAIRDRFGKLLDTLNPVQRTGPTPDTGIEYSLERLLARGPHDATDVILVAAATIDCRQRTLSVDRMDQPEYRHLATPNVTAVRFLDEIMPWVMSQLPPARRRQRNLVHSLVRNQIAKCYKRGFLT